MDFSHPHFAEPGWLWLAFLGPVLLFALQRYAAFARKRQLAKLAASEFLPDLVRSHSPARRLLKNALLLAAVAGIGLTLARPQWGETETAGQMLGRDTLFLLDCSRSMLAADVAPSRIQRSKLAILDYIQAHARGRVGLVAFAGQAFLQCPLTLDHGAFREALGAVDEKTIPVAGTDIGRALDEGFRAMEQGDREKVCILLTDGEDLEKGGVKTAEDLSKKGVVVYTIGVGTPSGAEIQMFDEQGRPELVRDSKGEVVRSRLDEKTLREIAQVTKGAYYPLGPVGEGLAQVRLSIEKQGGITGGISGKKLGVDRYHLPLAIVLVLLAVESLLGTRRRAGQAA